MAVRRKGACRIRMTVQVTPETLAGSGHASVHIIRTALELLVKDQMRDWDSAGAEILKERREEADAAKVAKIKERIAEKREQLEKLEKSIAA